MRCKRLEGPRGEEEEEEQRLRKLKLTLTTSSSRRLRHFPFFLLPHLGLLPSMSMPRTKEEQQQPPQPYSLLPLLMQEACPLPLSLLQQEEQTEEERKKREEVLAKVKEAEQEMRRARILHQEALSTVNGLREQRDRTVRRDASLFVSVCLSVRPSVGGCLFDL